MTEIYDSICEQIYNKIICILNADDNQLKLKEKIIDPLVTYFKLKLRYVFVVLIIMIIFIIISNIVILMNINLIKKSIMNNK
jgi:hypothetical protein